MKKCLQFLGNASISFQHRGLNSAVAVILKEKIIMNSFLRGGVYPDSMPSNGVLIPRKIYQTTKDINLVPKQLLNCINKLKSINQNWNHTLFDDRSQYEYIRSVGSERFIRAYDRIQKLHGASRADLFRYLIIFLHGGVYLDVKSGTSRPLDSILQKNDTFIISQWDNSPTGRFPGAGFWPELKNIPGGEYEQWNVIATPGHPFLAAVIENVINKIENYNALKFGHGPKSVLRVTGPWVYTLTIHPMVEFFPHRKVISYKEGLNYTMLDSADHMPAHVKLDALHYSKYMAAPVTPVGLTGWGKIKYFFGEMVIWPVSKIRYFNHQRIIKKREKNEKL
jgi:hypothetical protein